MKLFKKLPCSQCPHDYQLLSPLVASLGNYELEFSASYCLDVYNQVSNFLRYSSIKAPGLRKLGRPRGLTNADEEAVLELLLTEGWRRQDEIVFWLWCERNVLVSQSMVSRMLKRRKWNQKELRWISLSRSRDLRQGWREEMRQYAAEDLVFFDESIFNEKTGWRYQAYRPIEQDIRYSANTQREQT
ncbi:MAG: hypothetical protein M1813_007160 [Trichoglossum hirsutum]|nr:MAG: hypothetical protein M1813_007160 [Trichoglossum hirsutum]